MDKTNVEIKENKANEIKQKKSKSKIKGLLAGALALILLIGGTFAYFTDYVTTQANGTAGTVAISVDNQINLLDKNGMDIINPGDLRDFGFTVTSEGNKSIDTEVIITLTTTKPMSDNGGSASIEDKEVYSSEYELYWRDDVELIEGQGYYPKEGAKPVEVREINADKNQITYVISGDVLSGNEGYVEREVEYVLINAAGESADGYTVLEEGFEAKEVRLDDYYYESDGEMETWDFVIEVNSPISSDKIIIPQASDDFYGPATYLVVPAAYLENLTDLYISSDIKYVYILDENGLTDTGNIYVPNALYDWQIGFEQLAIDHGANVHVYDDFDSLMNSGSEKSVITSAEYSTLDDTEKAKYEMAPDSRFYDMVFLFDPYAGNEYQNTGVTVDVVVNAKQHRNTETGWELVEKQKVTVGETEQEVVDPEEIITPLEPVSTKVIINIDGHTRNSKTVYLDAVEGGPFTLNENNQLIFDISDFLDPNSTYYLSHSYMDGETDVYGEGYLVLNGPGEYTVEIEYYHG